jgi:hypothetical protein
MQPINKHSVLKLVRQAGGWSGFIAPNKVNSFHINGGWHIGMRITIILVEKEYKVLTGSGEYCTLSTFLDNFKAFNCIAELGNTVRFWETC